jgi:CubicO group peptidase (beta-lactamase class C family)
LAWGVVLDGRLAMAGGIGATSRTVFRIASMTKSFTAATVLALRDAGQLRLDDDVPLLAGVRATADSPPVTYRHVLSMDSGLPADDPWADRHMDLTAAEIDALVAGGLTFAVPTGTRFEYSNLGYVLLGDRSRDTTALLLEPLGLRRTSWTEPPHDDWARSPAGAPIGHGAFAGMGGLWSCVEDVATWVAWLDDAFPARDDPDDGPLRRSSRREMQQVHRWRAPDGGYGFGLGVLHDERCGTIVSHSGGLPGYGSNMRWLPGRRVGVVTLANATYAPMGALAQEMLGALDDGGLVPPVAPTPVPAPLQRAADGLVALLQTWDDDAADRLFADNVGLDEPYARRAAAAAELVAAHGSLHLERVVASSATRAELTVAGACGSFRVELMLAPPATGCIEWYAVRQ